MYLARQPQGNGFSESRSTVADNVIVIEGKRSETSGSQEPQSRSQPQLQSQSQPRLQQPLPPLTTTTSSANTRNRQTDPMRQHPSAWRLRDDDGDDDDDDDDKNEEEQVDDNVRSTLVHFRTYAFLLNERVTIVRVSVLHSDGKTRALEGDLGRLGHLPYEAASIPDRVPSRLGLRLLPSARHLNPIFFSRSSPSSSSSSFFLSSPSREMTHRVHLIRHDDDSMRRHSTHSHIHTFTRLHFHIYYIYVYILRPI